MTERWNMDGLAVLRAIAGDREVLDGILAALQRPLYRYISKLIPRCETAEDVLQDVLFRICNKIRWLRDPDLLRPWAFRIASRAVIALHYLEEMSLDEVAAVLEILAGTAKSRLAYGLARLRRHAAGSQINTGGKTQP